MTDLARQRQRLLASARVGSATECWPWLRAKYRNGYGQYGHGGGRNELAHRLAFRIFNGPIPPGMDVCHTCDVRACVNPAHLFLGTRADNLRDAARKNRLSRTHQKRGSAHPAAKLTEADIPVIRARIATGEAKRWVAADYGVSDCLIGLIARRRAWRHVA
jgi:hypothetical protein